MLVGRLAIGDDLPFRLSLPRGDSEGDLPRPLTEILLTGEGDPRRAEDGELEWDWERDIDLRLGGLKDLWRLAASGLCFTGDGEWRRGVDGDL